MASADFPFALTKELSPGKVLILSLRAVRLYLARLRMDMGLRGGQHAYRPYAASLPVRVPTVEDLFPASFSFPSTVARRVGPCGSLRLPPSVPTGSFHPARISPCWAHWRTAPDVPCRHSCRRKRPSNYLPSQKTICKQPLFAFPVGGGCEVQSTGARGASINIRAQSASDGSAREWGQAKNEASKPAPTA